MLDAGDIKQTIAGWVVIGVGRSELPSFRLPFQNRDTFHKKSMETHRGTEAMDKAISELSLKCNPGDAGKALYLLSAPDRDINMDMVKELGDYLRSLAPNAVIRNGDYPRNKGAVEVTVILSQLSDVEKVRNYYNKSTGLSPEYERRQQESESKLKAIEEAGKEVPSLLD